MRAAQAEAGARNAWLVAHARKNRYEFRGAAAPATVDNSTGTGVNETVAAAAALLTDALAKNGSLAVVRRSSSSDDDAGLDARQGAGWWMEAMVQNGAMPFAPAGYVVWRNVRDYGAKGDGSTDDTAAINNAITDGGRCGLSCGSTTTLQAVIYFPPGRYVVSGSIIQYYHTQFIGHVSVFLLCSWGLPGNNARRGSC